MTVASQYLPAAVSSGQTNTASACNIAKVYWYQPATVSNTVTLQDINGGLIWQGYCENANQSQVFEFPRPISVAGWQVSAIQSGTLYIYFA